MSPAGYFIRKYYLPLTAHIRENTPQPEQAVVAQDIFGLALPAGHIVEIGHVRNITQELLIAQGKRRDMGHPPVVDLGMRGTRQHPTSLFRLVQRYADFLVTEPRDRVYGLFGLLRAMDPDAMHPAVSYSIPLIDLYWKMMKLDIEKTGSLDFLCEAIGMSRPLGIPSWMPQWYDGIKKNARAQSILGLELSPELHYKATGDTLPLCLFSPRLKALRIAGYIHGIIEQVGGVAEFLGGSATDAERGPTASSDYYDDRIRQWVSMLRLEGVLGTSLPYRPKFRDPKNPTDKEIEAYTFMSTTLMVQRYHECTPKRFFDLYKRNVKDFNGSPFEEAMSEQTYLEARYRTAFCHRRLIVFPKWNICHRPRSSTAQRCSGVFSMVAEFLWSCG